ncbi:hypothetical protein ATZ33_09710 [Enterococcus silesiacus]|uniref:Glycosyl transferase family 1 domain-containing protein n=1 Tax=Enterococcus silesiacus TaxID=332949 RepID=A0ABM5W8U8_9ENTE|nr:glycosyltransferase [Enterococcus silesiacus]ALS01635.1 hypothetical protein ATZ33_09710 [Enterococcus silesiacus]
MKNNKTLILLTNYFPFWKGEEYLESEINYLSETFEKVIIIPVMINKNMKQTRAVSSNVSILNVSTDHSLKGKIQMLIYNWNGSIKNEIKKMPISFSKKLFEYYFQIRSLATWKIVKDEFEKEINLPINTSIYIYSYWFYLTSMVGIELKKHLVDKDYEVKKIISRAHGYDVNENANFLNYLPSREYLLSNMDFVYPVSTFGENMLKMRVPNLKEKVAVRKLGVKSISNKFFQHENKKIYLVSCSTIRPLKNIEKIIDTLSLCEKRGIDYKWIHLGSGKMSYEKKIHKYAKKKLTEGKYEFYGYVKNKDVMNVYKDKEVSLFINVSESEGTPVSVMEAFSMSLPVIASDVGGTSDIVKDGYNGILVDFQITPQDLLEKIIDLNNFSKEKYNEMSRNAFLTWQTMLSEEKNYQKFCQELLEGDI